MEYAASPTGPISFHAPVSCWIQVRLERRKKPTPHSGRSAMDSRRWRRANVLAVDDQPANLIALDAVLSDEFDVIRASSGEEALSILRMRDDIDVILMDAQMPVMDGFETAAKVKEIPHCRDTPIVFVTAVYQEDPFVKQGYKAGAVDY